MKFESIFDIDEQVYWISLTRQHKMLKCLACHGRMAIELVGTLYACPACSGRGDHIGPVVTAWNVHGPTRVGQIRMTQHLDLSFRVEYMLVATGVGSGTLHRQEDVYAIKETAQAEADRRTAEAAKEDQKQPA